MSLSNTIKGSIPSENGILPSSSLQQEIAPIPPVPAGEKKKKEIPSFCAKLHGGPIWVPIVYWLSVIGFAVALAVQLPFVFARNAETRQRPYVALADFLADHNVPVLTWFFPTVEAEARREASRRSTSTSSIGSIDGSVDLWRHKVFLVLMWLVWRIVESGVKNGKIGGYRLVGQGVSGSDALVEEFVDVDQMQEVDSDSESSSEEDELIAP